MSIATWLGTTARYIVNPVVYGFVLTRDGVPFLPHGNTAALVMTLGVWAIASIPAPGRIQWLAVARLFAVGLAAATIVQTHGHTTSMILVGSLVAAISLAAMSFPWLYGFVTGAATAAVVFRILGVHVRENQLLLSSQRWTEARNEEQVLLLVAFLFVTSTAHLNRREADQLRLRANEAEAARDAAITDERGRIARELHDVVSHHVTAMTLQAEAASMTGDREALAAVATSGRAALVELRSMLGVLRHTDPGGAASTLLAPQPGLDQLDELAAHAARGLQATVTRSGYVRTLPAGVELCIYRVVQEALTNSAKHGDATRADVDLRYEPDVVTVTIRDNGHPLKAPKVASGGLGLIGMRERVALLDGELFSHPRSDAAGYEVFMRVPVAK